MNVGVTSAVLASVVCLTIAIAILFKRPHRALYTTFAALSAALSLWHMFSLGRRLAHLGGVGRWQTAVALSLPPLAFLFFRELLRDRSARGRRMTRLAVAISLLLLLPNFSPLGQSLLVQLPLAAYVFVSLGLGLRALYLNVREARGEIESKRLSYVFYGGLAAFVLAWGELVPSVALPGALGHVATTFYIYFLYQSVVTRRLIDIVEFLAKAAVLAFLTLMLATVYALLMVWVGADQQGLWLFNTLVASFVILILYDQVRPRIEDATAKLLFRERYELRQVVRQLLYNLRTTISIDAMREQALAALRNTGRANQVAIYLAAAEEFSFSLFGYLGSKPPEVLNLSSHPTLLQELRATQRPIVLEQLSHRSEELHTLLTGGDPALQRDVDRAAEAITAMRELGASVLLPMLAARRIVGLFVLGAKVPGDAYGTDELACLLSLAEGCAVVIENFHAYERRRERDRLVAVGEMATGIAHEIRNPLGAIKGAAQYLDASSLPDDAREFINVIVEEVDRLNGVVGQFLEYARPWRGNPLPSDINAVVLATTRLLGGEAVPAGIEVRQDLAVDLPPVLIDPEQLKQVLINLVLNAVAAMPEGGTVVLKTEVSHHPDRRHACDVLVRVQDTGEGIAQENLPRIFVPFFTTKDNGTGLGLAISERIVENAGGRIDVSSRSGVGTTFTLRFPQVNDARRDQNASAKRAVSA